MPESPGHKAHPHPFRLGTEPPAPARTPALIGYAELQVASNFTFLTGASHPDELVRQAAALGHRAIAITDTNTLAGIVRGHIAAKETGIPFVVGCKLEFERGSGTVAQWQSGRVEENARECGTHFATSPLRHSAAPPHSAPSILIYPTSRPAYANLCRLLTLGKRRAEKAQCRLTLPDLFDHNAGLLAVVLPPPALTEEFICTLRTLREVFDDDRLSLAACRDYGPDDRTRLQQLATLSEYTSIPLVAVNNIHYHARERRPLQDVLTCIRVGKTIGEAGKSLLPHGEFHLKPPDEMARLFAGHPRAIARTVEIADRCAGFSLDQLRYEYPEETCPPGKTPQEHLTDLARAGAVTRYPRGVPAKVQKQIDHELALIDELQYARYFLTVHDIVLYARSLGILCQGRGAAANSAVCYCLGVTSVDPDRIDLLFERFVSRERKEPPDIDIDFEHERREEVIQYIYRKYGRDRAALTAEVISYRGRSAVREVGKAMGLSLDCVDKLAKSLDWWDSGGLSRERARELGLNPDDDTLRKVLILTRELLGFPRHLSQHVGGFVMTRTPLCELVPIENAAMEDRTVIEWDKDDIDALGMLKVDVLGLGMLTAIRRAFDFVNAGAGEQHAQAHQQGRPAGQVARGVAGCSEGPPAPEAVAAEAGSDRAPSRDHEPCDQSAGTDRAGASSRAEQGPRWRDVSALESRGSAELAPEEGGAGDGKGVDQSVPPFAGDVHRNGSALSGSAHSDVRALIRQDTASPPQILELHTVPPEDPAVYDAICHADTIGVFQIESRAQMSMLPRLKPRCFYDLVIEVAIVRPGPIQGNMVHPYLRRRNGEEKVEYPNKEVEAVLKKTLGVPLFQEQAMSLAMVAAGFTADEADQLRRAMAAWKRKGDLIYRFGQRLVDGMLARGYPREFAERCFEQIKGFSEYGFPESHAASFALLVYVSAWLKVHHPAAFAAALINSQPMGFYAPAQLVRDARDHGVEVRPIDVAWSGWDCRLEGSGEAPKWQSGKVAKWQSEGSAAGETRSALCHSATLPLCHSSSSPALRLGLRLVKGLGQADALRIEEAVRRHGPFATIESLWRASGAKAASMRALAAADAFGSMGLDRQHALWQVRALKDEELPLFDEPACHGQTWHGLPAHEPSDHPAPMSPPRPGPVRSSQPPEIASPHATEETRASLPPIPAPVKVSQDYAATGLSLKAHPLSFIRDELTRRGIITAGELRNESKWPNNRPAAVAGIVLVRQRPGTASGIVFFTIEDETGAANLIVRPHIYERFRRAARHSTAIIARGTVERQGEVVHILVKHIAGLDRELRGLQASSRDFH